MLEMPQDKFLLLLPLPYRIALLIIFGTGLWSGILYWYKGLPRLIGYTGSPTPWDTALNLAIVQFNVFCLPSILIYHKVAYTASDSQLLTLPNITLLIVLLLFLPINIPGTWMPRHGRSRLCSTFKRIALGGLARNIEERFGDILAADALTSYSSIFPGLYICLCLCLPKYVNRKSLWIIRFHMDYFG